MKATGPLNRYCKSAQLLLVFIPPPQKTNKQTKKTMEKLSFQDWTKYLKVI